MWVCVPPTYGEKSVKVVSQKSTVALHSRKPPEHVLCFLTQSCETRIMMDYGQCSFIHAIRFMNFILNNQPTSLFVNIGETVDILSHVSPFEMAL